MKKESLISIMYNTGDETIVRLTQELIPNNKAIKDLLDTIGIPVTPHNSAVNYGLHDRGVKFDDGHVHFVSDIDGKVVVRVDILTCIMSGISSLQFYLGLWVLDARGAHISNIIKFDLLDEDMANIFLSTCVEKTRQELSI